MYPDLYALNLMIMKTLYSLHIELHVELNEAFIQYVETRVLKRDTEECEYLSDAMQTHEVTADWNGSLPIVDFFE